MLAPLLACLLLSPPGQLNGPLPELRLGEGRHAYAWERGFAAEPGGRPLGNTHGGIAFDSAGRCYFNTDTERAIIVLGPAGEYLKSFGAQLAGGAHSLLVHREGSSEFLYLAHHGKHHAVKMTLEGEVVLTIGWPKESGLYEREDEFRPTSVAVADNGDIYIADGYGLSYVHRYDKSGKLLHSFGGHGTGEDQLRTCHGLWLDRRGETPILLVADRENGRIQTFDLAGRHLKAIAADLRRPCGFAQVGDDIAVADLAGRVSIFDRSWNLVVHLGDQSDPAKRAQNGIPPEQWTEGQFISPHSCAFDALGNLYVMDWVSTGRLTKLRRVAR